MGCSLYGMGLYGVPHRYEGSMGCPIDMGALWGAPFMDGALWGPAPSVRPRCPWGAALINAASAPLINKRR